MSADGFSGQRICRIFEIFVAGLGISRQMPGTGHSEIRGHS